jgi:hypothetical protein
VVISRRNNRRLTVGNLDWVKNGDRWHVTNVSRDGSIQVQSLHSRYSVNLPAAYVRDWADLGYAITIHGAQGVTADTMHGLATGAESRQQLYTMLTRGRQANHLYVQVVGDGDPHALAHTDAVSLLTAVERLERALTHDEAPVSATTQLRDQDDPVRLLGPAVARYSDALGVAAEQVLGTDVARHLDESADQIVLWLSECAALPTLRADLLGLAADGNDPVMLLRQAATMGDLDSAHDPAAVLDHRVHLLVPHSSPGPLPWLRGIPSQVVEDPVWGPYLQARAARVDGLADDVRFSAAAARVSPIWLGEMHVSPRVREVADLVVDIAVWRAAMDVPSAGERPTGEPALGDAAARWQHDLDSRLERVIGSQPTDWARVLPRLDPAIGRDPLEPDVVRRLQALKRRGIDLAPLLKEALAQGPLPDDYAASALMWRVVGLVVRGGQVSGSAPASGSQARKTKQVTRPISQYTPPTKPGRNGPRLGY